MQSSSNKEISAPSNSATTVTSSKKNRVVSSMGGVGMVAGAITAISMKKGFWTTIGFMMLGGILMRSVGGLMAETIKDKPNEKSE